jgi:hypothetical protein
MQLQSAALLISFVLPFSVSLQVAKGQQGAVSAARQPSEQLSVGIKKGLVTADVRNQPLSVLMDEFASQGQLSITVAEDLGAENVVIELNRVPLDEALRRLLSKYDVFYYYAGTGDTPAVLRAVWVYAKGTATGVKPVPPEAWAGNDDLLKSTADTDSAVRERAYEALIARPDRRTQDLVIAALRGFREKDEGIRQRLLSRAITSGMPIPFEVLADMARADSSEQIRWIALDALAQDSTAAKTVAEAALTDASESVRVRAKEILAEVSGKERGVGRSQEPEVQP